MNKIISIRIDSNLKRLIDILKNRYSLNPSNFIRDAIIEKMKRDIKTLRVDREKKIKKSDIPF